MKENKDVKQQLDELEELALPLQKWLEENYNPHFYVAIDMHEAVLGETFMSVKAKEV
ncbi:hypothetical protein NVP1253O_05 [Vibrio phage 1.253.O._10N.286.45.B12]|nr:hypothetical protein NVP1235O_05 [Vibrio phage 1.235.O._10N.261.52.B2]AUR98529.1 hypothetical protein NVP1253O_05 [Vibrio phage 1.253.O._10N.286.45.B12]